MPARPMYRSPHKKDNPWSRGYQPTFTKYGAGAGQGGHSGNTPLGKKKKRDRTKTGPVGSPNGVHDDRNPQDCRCGRCLTLSGATNATLPAGWKLTESGVVVKDSAQ